MILEDPITGLSVLAALAVVAVVARIVFAPVIRRVTAPEPPLRPVLQALRDLEDEELQDVAKELRRLPERDRRVQAAAQPLAAALLDWRSTFDEGARQNFLDLASALLSRYDRGQHTH